MRYQVATIVSVLVGVLFVAANCMQARREEHQSLAIRASLHKLDIRQLSSRYWDCLPQYPGERYRRDSVYCGEVGRALEARSGEFPALQVVKVMPQGMLFPVPNDATDRKVTAQLKQ